MLKIKNNVDLKELAKFGFEEVPCVFYKEYIRTYDDMLKNEKTVYIDGIDRKISISPTRGSYQQFNTDIELDIIFDLIEAKLVEKVEENI